MGNIYLNGNESFYGNYSLQKNLNNNDKMVIENYNRMIFVYRKQQGRNMDEAFILDDNIDYYLYVAMKGPIQIEFLGE